jgi:catechol 2,3-dioxygenase-like lactoylglutathione lyase family enzyme
MLDITNVNHVGIRISDKAHSVDFYSLLGFDLVNDVGFESGHPVIMKHPSGLVLNLLGPADVPGDTNILMDVDEKHTGITHVALTVGSLAQAKEFVSEHDIKITGSFSFGYMSAIFIRDPDRNVIELDAYEITTSAEDDGYTNHP